MAIVREEDWQNGILFESREILRVGGNPSFQRKDSSGILLEDRAATVAETARLVSAEDSGVAEADKTAIGSESFAATIATLQNAFDNWATLTVLQKDSVNKLLVRLAILTLRGLRLLVKWLG